MEREELIFSPLPNINQPDKKTHQSVSSIFILSNFNSTKFNHANKYTDAWIGMTDIRLSFSQHEVSKYKLRTIINVIFCFLVLKK